jgi:predicted nucleic acid-binding protein
MNVVINTSPIVWLDSVNSANLVTKLYYNIYTSPSIKEDLLTFDLKEETKNVINNFVIRDRINVIINDGIYV